MLSYGSGTQDEGCIMLQAFAGLPGEAQGDVSNLFDEWTSQN